MKIPKNILVKAALGARKNAYCPYSRYAVGAAALASSGKIYRGANVENSSFGLSLCAERAALFNAASAGERKITALCVAGISPKPCGACRQVLLEFADPDCPVFLADAAPGSGRPSVSAATAGRLLPRAFSFGDKAVKP